MRKTYSSRGNAPGEPGHYVHALRFPLLTPVYDRVVRLTTRERRFKAELILQAEISAGMQVLDLGCGTGTLTHWAWQHQPHAQFTGVDADNLALALARRKSEDSGTQITFVSANARELPFPDNYFDRVLSSLFFHHLTRSEKLQTAREVLRILKPGGALHVADWGAPTGIFMRMLFVPIRLLDGIERTSDNAAGLLMPLVQEAGFARLCERGHVNTPCGTLRLFTAGKPARLESSGTLQNRTGAELKMADIGARHDQQT